MEEDNQAPWYHGSPHHLTTLRPGSTITQNRRLAEVFSHKPSLVTIEDDGAIRHNGTAQGLLYQIIEAVQPEDVTPHPRTSMPLRFEWLTTRALRLTLLGPVEIREEEILTEADLKEIQKRLHPESPAHPAT